MPRANPGSGLPWLRPGRQEDYCLVNKKVIVFGLDGLNQHRRRFAGMVAFLGRCSFRKIDSSAEALQRAVKLSFN